MLRNNHNPVELTEDKSENANFAFTYPLAKEDLLNRLKVFKQFLQLHRGKGFIGIYSIATGSFICQRLSHDQNKQEVINGLRSTDVGSEQGSFIFGGTVGNSLYYLNENGVALKFDFDSQTYTLKTSDNVTGARSYSYSQQESVTYTCAIKSLTTLSFFIDGLLIENADVEKQHEQYLLIARFNIKVYKKLCKNVDNNLLEKLRKEVFVTSQRLVKPSEEAFKVKLGSLLETPTQRCIGIVNVQTASLELSLCDSDWARSCYIDDFAQRASMGLYAARNGDFLFEITPVQDNRREVKLLDTDGSAVDLSFDADSVTLSVSDNSYFTQEVMSDHFEYFEEASKLFNRISGAFKKISETHGKKDVNLLPLDMPVYMSYGSGFSCAPQNIPMGLAVVQSEVTVSPAVTVATTTDTASASTSTPPVRSMQPPSLDVSDENDLDSPLPLDVPVYMSNGPGFSCAPQNIPMGLPADEPPVSNWTGFLKILTLGGATGLFSWLLMADAVKLAAIAGVSSAAAPVLVPIAVGGALLGGYFFAKKCVFPTPPAPDSTPGQSQTRGI